MKNIKSILIQARSMCYDLKKNNRILRHEDFKQARLEADIIRLVHSIEKGLSICNPRPGFGIDKIKRILAMCEIYSKNGYSNKECLLFARDALWTYLEWNDKNNFTNGDLYLIKKLYGDLFGELPKSDDVYGGMIELNSDDFKFNINDIENLFETRHSIREFSGEAVTDEEIRKAVKLAQRSPSACNRQGVRVYSVSSKKYIAESGKSLEGIGGFAQDVDKFLLITAKQSAYGLFENNQYIVSASMFAGYLTLALHAYGIAACTVQRSLSYNSAWENFCKKNNIPGDEQIVVMIGIGKYKKTTKVPVSKRLNLNYIYRNLDK
ncbi:MAG: nitroreductase family protein [Ruminococcaceae bacterium]|nr:nitroreductase family protein [Oscillospiraceae bacterium]